VADKTEVFGIDLDTSALVDKAKGATDAIRSIGNAENLRGLISAIDGLLPEMALLVGAIAAVKLAIDSAFNVEQIKTTEKAFEVLAESIGVAGDNLKNGLVGAAGGLANTTDILKSANQAMILLGSNAERIPQVMELAHKMTVNFGGDLLERFNSLNYAIASGSERMLRANGIAIDTSKALRNFAASLGVSTGALTEAGRQQAIMNAALEAGNKNLKNLSNSADGPSEAYAKLGVQVKSLWEEFNKVLNTGGFVTKLFNSMAESARYLTNELKTLFSTGMEKDSASIEVMTARLETAQKKMEEMRRVPGYQGDPYYQMLEKQAAQYEKQINEMGQRLQKQQAHNASLEVNGNQDKNSKKYIDDQIALKEKIALQEATLKMAMDENAREIKLARDQTQLKNLQYQRELQLAKMHDLQIQKLDNDAKQKGLQNDKMVTAQKELIDKKYYSDLALLRKQNLREQEDTDQNALDNAKTLGDGISAAAHKSANEANRAFNDMGKQGTLVMQTILNEGKSSFQQLGKGIVDGSSDASDAMKSFFLNALADMAEAEGEMLLASGLVNPANFAAGAALITLSGAIRAMASNAGGSTSSSFASGSGAASYSSGAYGTGEGYGTGSSQSMSGPQMPEKKEVTVQIMGDFLNTDQTKRLLLQYVRDATDATDFKYVQIGQS
jgi:hypothetical protein